MLVGIFILSPLLVVGLNLPAGAATAQTPGNDADVLSQCGLSGELLNYSLVAPPSDTLSILGADTGLNTDIQGQLDFGVAYFSFEMSKVLVTLSIVTICEMFSFAWAGKYSEAMGSVGESFYWGLREVYDWAIIATIFYVSFFLMRGHIIRGIREFGLTYLIFGLYLAAGLTNSDGFTGLTLDVIEFTSQSSGAVAQTTLEGQLDGTENCENHVIVSGEQTIRSPHAVSCPFASLIQSTFIREPYDQLNWGADLDSLADDSCALARDEILRDVSPFDGDEVRQRMRDAGGDCVDLAEFNENPDAPRWPFALMQLVFVILPMSGIFMLLGFVGLATQFLLVLTIIALPWALIFGLMPGYSRTIWWRWFGLLFRVVAVFVTLSAFLSIYLVSLKAVIDSTDEDNWFVRSMLLIFLALIMMVALAKMLRGAKGASQLSAARMAQLTQGDPPVWLPEVAGGHSNTVGTTGSGNVYRGYRDYKMRQIARRGSGGGGGGGGTNIRRQKIKNINKKGSNSGGKGKNVTNVRRQRNKTINKKGGFSGGTGSNRTKIRRQIIKKK